MVIVVDFDGTLTLENTYPKCKSFDVELIDCLIECQRQGHEVILNTCREGELLEDAVISLESLGLVCDKVNENSDTNLNKYPDYRKISGDVYLDDSSFNWNRKDAKEFLRSLPKVENQKQSFQRIIPILCDYNHNEVIGVVSVDNNSAIVSFTPEVNITTEELVKKLSNGFKIIETKEEKGITYVKKAELVCLSLVTRLREKE